MWLPPLLRTRVYGRRSPRTSCAPCCRVCAGEVGRTHDAGVVDEFGGRELRLGVETARRQVCEVRLADGLEEQFTRGRDTAAEHEQLRVEHSAERCGGLTEPAAQLA